MQYIQLFLEGIITFISPCLLPMLPVYVSYLATDKKNPIANAVAFVLGFTAIFVLLGAFAGTVGGFFTRHEFIVNLVTGGFIVLLGLGYLGVFRLPQLTRVKWRVKVTGPATSALFGVVFAIAWTPCVSAFLGAALLRASLTGSALEGSVMLFVFAMGLGVPFIASALLLDSLKTVFDFIKKNYRIINALAGGLLIIVGLLIMTGLFGRYLMLWS